MTAMEGVKALVPTETNISNLHYFYKSLVDEVILAVHKTKYHKRNKNKFISYVLIIICRGFVCLDLLEKNERRTNNVFAIDKYERKDLICDMEKPSNILKTINYFAKHNIALE